MNLCMHCRAIEQTLILQLFGQSSCKHALKLENAPTHSKISRPGQLNSATGKGDMRQRYYVVHHIVTLKMNTIMKNKLHVTVHYTKVLVTADKKSVFCSCGKLPLLLSNKSCWTDFESLSINLLLSLM